MKRKNLVCLHFLYHTEPTIIKLFEPLKFKYNFDMMTVMTKAPTFEFHGYNNKLCCYFIEYLADIQPLIDNHSEYKEHFVGYKILLTSYFDVSEFIDDFNADWFINVTKFDYAKEKVEYVLDKYFNCTACKLDCISDN